MTEENASNPLQIILKRLDDMQGQITSLKNRSSEVSASIASVHSEEGEASDEDSTVILYMTLLTQKNEIGHLHQTTQTRPFLQTNFGGSASFVRTRHS